MERRSLAPLPPLDTISRPAQADDTSPAGRDASTRESTRRRNSGRSARTSTSIQTKTDGGATSNQKLHLLSSVNSSTQWTKPTGYRPRTSDSTRSEHRSNGHVPQRGASVHHHAPWTLVKLRLPAINMETGHSIQQQHFTHDGQKSSVPPRARCQQRGPSISQPDGSYRELRNGPQRAAINRNVFSVWE